MTRRPTVRLCLTDRMVADALAEALRAGDFEVLPDDDGADAAPRHPADVVLVDRGPVGRSWPGRHHGVVVVGPADATAAAAAFRLGSRGYVTTGSTADELRAAVGEVAAGGIHVPDELAAELGRRAVSGGILGDVDQLSERQRQVVLLLVAGVDRHAIAAELGISVATVRTHLRDGFARLGVHSTIEAAALLRAHLT